MKVYSLLVLVILSCFSYSASNRIEGGRFLSVTVSGYLREESEGIVSSLLESGLAADVKVYHNADRYYKSNGSVKSDYIVEIQFKTLYSLIGNVETLLQKIESQNQNIEFAFNKVHLGEKYSNWLVSQFNTTE
mmetsp:Transcript_27589/g.28728  ORF Transcript_27589/g.28728 Transcript_27589/m.28728 type:complete len:133 (-) Transcript_27589:106-504(-)